jgi:co-chaperonin GroES (HSP10)
MKLTPLKGNIFAQLETGERISRTGIVILDDNGKEQGIRPRWAKVWLVADDIKDVAPGQYILVEHGRWTKTITIKDDDGSETKFQKIDPNGILCVSNELPGDLDLRAAEDYSSSVRAEDFGAR